MQVLILAPISRDKDLLCTFMHKRGLSCVAVQSVEECTAELARGTDTLLVTEEALRDLGAFRLVLAELVQEPEWSDLPVIALVDPGFVRTLHPQYDQQLQNINLTFIERPVRAEVIGRALTSALRARARQYEVRDFLAEKLRTQENLWRIQKLESIGVLAGGIAHDFNNLLTGIMGNASLVHSLVEKDDEVVTYIEEIMRASGRAADLTRQLLAYSGRGNFVLKPVDVSFIAEEAAALIRSVVNPRVDLEFDLDRDLHSVIGDRTQLEQVIVNLVINAGESIPEGRAGWVRLSTNNTSIVNDVPDNGSTPLEDGDYVRFTVADNGGGMSTDTIQRIFEPFFTTKFTGRGLGLAAVQGIVHAHCGSIHVESEPGRGSCFTILLPAAVGMDTAEIVSPAMALTTVHPHILIVDDEEMVRDIAQTCLTRLGYQTSLADNGREALAILGESEGAGIALIVLDWTMPTMDGAEFLLRIQERNLQIPVVVTSGYAESHLQQFFADSKQIVGFLQKPFQIQALSEAIDRALRTRHSESSGGNLVLTAGG